MNACTMHITNTNYKYAVTPWIKPLVCLYTTENVKMACIIGDMNINMLCDAVASCLNDFIDIYDPHLLNSGPTCFKSEAPTSSMA